MNKNQENLKLNPEHDASSLENKIEHQSNTVEKRVDKKESSVEQCHQLHVPPRRCAQRTGRALIAGRNF